MNMWEGPPLSSRPPIQLATSVQIHRKEERGHDPSGLFLSLLEDIEESPRADAFIFFDQRGTCLYVSPLALRLLGLDTPKHFRDIHPPEGELALEGFEGFEVLITARARYSADLTLQDTLSCKVELQPVLNEQEVHGVLACYILAARQPKPDSLLDVLIETLPLGVVVSDESGNIQLCNKETLRITGRTEWSSLHETRPYILRTPRGDVLDSSYGPIKRTIHQGRREMGEETFLLDFGQGTTRRITTQVRRVQRGAQSLYVGFFRDVTELHERELRKDEFISIASHELRNPLTPLKGLLQIALQQHEHDGSVDRQLLTKSLKQVDRLTKLVDGLLDLSRLETGRLSFAKHSIDLVAWLDEIMSIWRGRHRDDRFQLECERTPILLEVDAAGLEQVLNNLLDNALKFSPENTPITVRLFTTSHHATLQVEDMGVGLDAEAASKVFERFYQGKNAIRSGGSLGLGLYISRKIVREHDGSISLRSERGERTVVEVSLPLR